MVTTHAAAGALLARAGRRRPAVVAAGLLSHYALDMLPHWGFSGHEHVEVGDPRFLKVAVPDGLVALGLLGVLARRALRTRTRADLVTLLAAGAATVPDLDKPFDLLTGRAPFPQWHSRFHGWIQREDPKNLRREIAVAAGLSAIALLPQRGAMQSR